MDNKEVSYILNELGEERELYYNAVTPPIIQTSNFGFRTVREFRSAFMVEPGTAIYTPRNNPSRDILSQKMAALDGAESCLMVNSGTAAIFASVMAQVQPGDHIVSVQNPYSWAHHLMADYLPRFQVSTTFVDGRVTANIENAIRPNTKIIYLESPNSWSFHLQDLEAIAAIARKKGILTICDNSYSTPLYQRPITLGIDIAIQSVTKYINGHSDTVAGAITGSKKLIDKMLQSEFLTAGLALSPFNSWLVLRGLRTLPARLEQIAKTTEKVFPYLKSQKKIESISFPGDPDFPQAELAKKQMLKAAGLLSFVLKTRNPASIEAFCDAMQHILMAVSWGGYESLIMPSLATMDRKDFDPDNPEHRRVRFYIGTEDPDYIIEDLNRGFAAIKE